MVYWFCSYRSTCCIFEIHHTDGFQAPPDFLAPKYCSIFLNPEIQAIHIAIHKIMDGSSAEDHSDSPFSFLLSENFWLIGRTLKRLKKKTYIFIIDLLHLLNQSTVPILSVITGLNTVPIYCFSTSPK